MELAGAGAHGRVVGVGPERARSATAQILTGERPTAVLHVGIAGARRASGIPLLAVVTGTEAVDCDGGMPPVLPDPVLLRVATTWGAGPERIGTSAAVGGTRDVAVEAMEGHAVLSVCRDAGVPAVEVRVVSNHVEEPDRAMWRFDEAFAEVARVTRALLPEVVACLS